MRNVDYHGVFARKLQENCVFQAILLGSSQNSALRVGSMTRLGQGEQRNNVRVITVGNPEPAFHPGRVLVRFKGDTGPRVIPTPDPMVAIARYRADNSVPVRTRLCATRRYDDADGSTLAAAVGHGEDFRPASLGHSDQRGRCDCGRDRHRDRLHAPGFARQSVGESRRGR